MKKRALAYLLSAAMVATSLGSADAVAFAQNASSVTAAEGEEVQQDAVETESSIKAAESLGSYKPVTAATDTYVFGTDVTADSGYTAEAKKGFTKEAYPKEAAGWVDGVYYPRVVETTVGDTSYVAAAEEALAISSKVWKETESTGYGVYTYEETDRFDIDCVSADYTITVEFKNPTSAAYHAYLKAEDIVRSYTEEIKENGESKQVTTSDIEVPANGTKEITVNACVVDGQLNLKFLGASSATTEASAKTNTVYVSKVVVNRKATEAAGDKPTIFLASDSTVQSYAKGYYPQTGWGQVLYENFGAPVYGENGEVEQQNSSIRSEWMTYETENVIVDNRALGGRSSSLYITEGLFDYVLEDIKPGDYLLIQWGHNDATASRPNRYVAADDFEKWLQKYVDGAIQRGATPVLVTPVARRSYSTAEDGTVTFNENFKAYGDVMRKMASEQNLPIIDLSARSIAICNKFGAEGSKALFLHINPGDYEGNYANGATDDTHLQYYGAHKFAQCVAEGILESDHEALKTLKSYVTVNAPEISPGEVTGLEVAGIGVSSITMTWEKDENSELYYVYRKELTAEEAKAVADGTTSVSFSTEDEKYAVTSTNKYIDSGCSAGNSYAYAVRGFNELGMSETFSNVIVVTTKDALYKFDINVGKNGANTTATLDGWTGVDTTVMYNEERGYGWTKKPTNGRDGGANAVDDSNDMTRDFAADGEFAVDLPNGTYEVTFYSGYLASGVSASKTTFYVNGTSLGTIGAKQAIAKLTTKVQVTTGRMNVTYANASGSAIACFNGMTITELLKAPTGFGFLDSETKFDTDNGKMTATMQWSDTNDASLISGYKIYLKGSSDTDFRVYKSFTKEELEKSELDCKAFACDLGETYEAYMTCVAKDGTEARSEIIEIEALDKDTPLPSAPANVRCTSPVEGSAELQSSITIEWDAEPTAFKYVVYRSTHPEDFEAWQSWEKGVKKSGSEWFEKVAEVRGTSYTDEDMITTNVPYYYKVAAVNIGGMGAESAVCESNVAGTLEPANLEKYTDRALVGVNLAGKSGAETLVSATDNDGNTYTSGIYLSWRSFESDFTYHEDGSRDLTTTFTVYKNGSVLAGAENISVTNLIDPNGTADDTYKVVGSNDAAIGVTAIDTKPWAEQYQELSLYVPADGVDPFGFKYSYSANDLSVGDVDGDGQLELIVKWYPTNAQDNSSSTKWVDGVVTSSGYTGETFLDTYDVNYATGEVKLLSRINMGINIRSGAHYTQFQVWDFDGDGKAEVAAKTSDGTTSYVSKDGTDQTLEMVDFVGAVDASKLPVSVQQTEKEYDYRINTGHVRIGTEYFSIFNLDDGSKAADDVDYLPERGPADDMQTNWGDSTGDTYGNRSERYLSGVAYLDGQNPYAVFTRGYYARIAMTAYYLKDTDNDKIGDTIDIYWLYDTGNEDGNIYRAQGNHGLSINDVDNDGKDEIVFGSLVVDNDGTALNNTGLEHGDALHVSDWMPWRDGLEVMDVHEHEGISLHVEVHDAETGEVLMGYYTGKDTGRGAAADIDPTAAGAEWWSIASPTYESNDEPAWDSNEGEVYSMSSTLDSLVKLADTNPPANFTLYWDGDLLSEIQDHTFDNKPYLPIGVNILKWNYETEEAENLLYSEEIWSNNGTKGNVGLVADILGDWREEIITRTTDAKNEDGTYQYNNNTIRIYSTTIHTDYVVPCLLENLAYREGIAWQNIGYNQPANLDYLLSEGVVTAQLEAGEANSDSAEILFTEASDGKYGHEIEGYEIYRASGDGEYEKIDTITVASADKTNDQKLVYTDKTVKENTTYNYKVAAIVDGKTSYMSRPVSILTAINISEVLPITLEDITQDTPLEEGQTVADLLPKTVDVKNQKNETLSAQVTWDVSKVDLTTPGTYKVGAKVQGYADTIEVDLKVVPNTVTKAGVTDIYVVMGTVVTDELPEKVELTFMNNTTREVAVTWNEADIAKIDVNTKTGDTPAKVTGTCEGVTGYTLEVNVHIVDDYVVSLGDVHVEVDFNATEEEVAAALPATVAAVYKSGKTGDATVTWSEINVNTKVAGKAVGTASYTTENFGAYKTAVIDVVYPLVKQFDFGVTGSPTADGWIAVAGNVAKGTKTVAELGIEYTAEKGYGFLDGTAVFEGRPMEKFTMDTSIPENVYRDFLMPQNNTFAVDLPNGKYEVTMIGATASNGTNRVQGTFNDSTAVSIASAGGAQVDASAAIKSYEVTVTDGQLTFTWTNSICRTNAMIIRAIPDVPEEPGTEEPGTETTSTEKPGTETTSTEKPGTETTSTEKPGTETTSTEKPGTETTSTEKPGTETTSTEKPGTEIPIEKADKSQLVLAIAAAKEIKEADYTANSYAAVAKALAAAEAVNAKENATQTEVNDAVSAINDAFKGLVQSGDKSELAKAIATAKGLKEADYTAESFAAVTKALADAEKVNADNNATQDDVNAAVIALNNAFAGLKPAEKTPETPGADAGTPINSGANKFVVTTAGGVPSVEFTGSTATGKVTIPATVVSNGVTYKVTSIAAGAFKNNKKITSVTIGANVTKIGANAFLGCTKLKTVTIGANVTTIGASAFKGCTALAKITIPGKVTTIGANAFSGCKKLATVKIGAKVTSIGNSAFANCVALKKITIPNKVKTIGSKAFSGCKKLTTVTIGTGVTKIGTQAFKGCGKLAKITIKSTKLKTVGKNAFKGINAKAKIKVPAKKLTNYKKLLKGKGQGSKVTITK